MDIDSIQWKSIILTVLISLLLPKLLITEASQNENKTDSCENGTGTWPTPMSFDPYEPASTLKVFSPADPSPITTLSPLNTIKETPKASLEIKLTPSPIIHGPSQRIEPTPTIIRYLISSSLPSPSSYPPSLQSKELSSHIISADDDENDSLSSSMVVSTPLLSSSVQSTPINELIRESISLYRVSSSSPVQSSSVVTSILLSPSPIIIVNESVTFPSDASHTVIPDIPAHQHHQNNNNNNHHHQHHGQQPYGTIDGSIYRVSQSGPKNWPNEPLTTITTNYDNETLINMKTSPTTTITSIDFTSYVNNSSDNSVIINGTSLSHNPSPASSFFPALSGTISFIPNEGTTDITFPWTTSIDNIIYYNNNNETNHNDDDDDVDGGGDSQNHHGTPEAATSNITKCDHRENRFTQPAPESGFLVRSVLKRYGNVSPLSLVNLTATFESRLAEIFNLAYRNQLKGLGVNPDKIEKDIHVKLWNLFWINSTDDLHLIYQIEQDNHKLIARDLQTLLSHISPDEMSTILGYNGTIKAEPYVNTVERKNNLASALKDLDWIPFLMIFLSVIVLIFCSLLTLIIWRKNRRLRSSSPNSSPEPLGHSGLGNSRLKTKSSIAKPINKVNTKESLVNWRKVSGPGSKRSFLGSHGGSAAGLNISGGCSATSGTIDSNHEFEYLSFDSPTSSLKLRTAEYRPLRPYGFSNHGLHGSQSRLELTKEKVIPIGELDEIAELSSNSSSHDAHHPHHHLNHNHQHGTTPGSRVTYVTTKEEMIGDYENPLMRSSSGGAGGSDIGVDEVDCSVPQLIQVHISEQTQNIIQAIRSELKKFNPITGTNVQSQSQSIPTQYKESTSTSDA